MEIPRSRFCNLCQTKLTKHLSRMELRAHGGRVRTMQGCIGAEESVAALVAEIEKGNWSGEFIMGRLFSE